MKLILRKDVKNNKAYYNLFVAENIKYSVVDFGEVMKNAPKELSHCFSGWEAIKISETGVLLTDTMIRANSKKELIEAIENKHKHDMNILKSIKEAVSIKQPVAVEQKGTYYHLKPEKVGSIGHCFYVHKGQVTRYENEYSKEKTSLPLNSAATLSEVESLISVLMELREIMKKTI